MQIDLKKKKNAVAVRENGAVDKGEKTAKKDHTFRKSQ